MAEIIPTILTKDYLELQNKIKSVEGIVPRIQIDVIDGVFVSNKTFNLDHVKDFDHSLKVDVHLMVKEPAGWVGKCLMILANRVIGQVEMMGDYQEFIKRVLNSGMDVGLALDLETSVEKVPREIYHQLDLVLLMSVKAGFGGQKFNPKVLEKIRTIKKMVGDLVDIAVDGGLDEKNIVECKRVGASIFYVGKTFWEAEDLRKRYEELTKL